MTTESEKLALHFKYCTLIFTILIIGIATDRWTAQKDFTAYLSNAATMTSLLLGLVAIFYSFISNDSLSKSLGSITTVSLEVKETKEQISQYLNLTKEATNASSANANQLQSVSKEVSFAIDSLSYTLKEIAEQSKSLQSLVTSVPIRIDQLEVNFTKALGEKTFANQTTPAIGNQLSDAMVDRFLARSPLSSNLLTYACILAYETKIKLSIKDICDALEIKSTPHMSGYLDCMHSAVLITKKIQSATVLHDINYVHPRLIENTKNYFENYINRIYADNLDTKNEWLSKLNKIKKLYEI